ncbi:MAG: response regulator [Oscillospiraceae bacterium]
MPKTPKENPGALSGTGKASDQAVHFSGHMGAIIEAAHIGLWDWDLRTGRVIYSKEWEAIAGYAAGEVPQHISFWESVVFPPDLAPTEAQIDRLLRGEVDQYEAEFRMLRKDGSVIWAQDKGLAIERDEAGRPTRLAGVLQDVSRLKAAEAELQEKSEQLDFIAGISGLGTWDWDIPANHIRYNDDYLAVLGYTQNEIGGSLEEWGAFNHPDDLPGTNQALQDYLSGKADGYSHETRMRHKDGHYVWTLDIGRIVAWDADGKPTRMLGGHLNIDKHKRDEERLQHALEENERHNERLQEDIQSAVQKLDEAQEYNQLLFDANPYVNVIFDSQFRPLNCNPAAIEYFGFPSKQSLLDNLIAAVNAAVPQFQPNGAPSIPLAQRFKTVLETGYLEFETELVIGQKRTPMHAIFKRIRHKDQIRIAAYMADMSTLREAKNELLRQDLLLKSVNTAAARLLSSQPEDFDTTVWSVLKLLGEAVDADRVYIWENFTQNGKLHCRQIYEWSEGAEPQQGKAFAEGTDYDDVPAWRDTLSRGLRINALVKDLSAEERATLEPQGVQSIFTLPVFFRGEFWGFVGFDECKAERLFSEMEEKVLQSGANLIVSAILRNEMTTNLIAAREEAVANAHAKSDFLSRMSHEIRTPMNAIIGMTTIAKKMKDLDKINYCLQKIDVASQQLLDIINDILDMSKIESGKFEIVPAPFDFEKMMQNVSSFIQLRVEEKEQTFHFDFQDIFSRTMISDELRLSQVITNLLTNAVKFTPEKGTVALRVRILPIDEDHATLHIEVQDDGIGISPEQQKKLFRSFEQADGSITRRFGGTGLGLAICRQIVTLMGGRIWVKSTLGKGSCFAFEVPVSWGLPLEATTAPKLPRKDLRILVVDDSEDVRLYFQNILATFSMSCDIAAGGAEAVELVRAHLQDDTPYDLVFLDWKMPGMNGAETARQIMELSDHVIVVMISVADWNEVEKEVSEFGITHFLSKPILPSVLFNTIVKVAENALINNAVEHPPTAYHWQGKTLLLVEDMQINREILVTILEETGVAIETATTGLEAVEKYKASNGRYSLILMDVQMPEMDGLTATREIRASGLADAGSIPILAMTANAFSQDVQNCLAAGMNGHMAKPIDVDSLLATLSEYLDT